MRTPISGGGHAAYYALPDFTSITIEVAIRDSFASGGTSPLFAFGIATAGTASLDVEGPGLTLTENGRLIGMDDFVTSSSNFVETGSAVPDTGFTVIKLEWTTTAFRIWRDGVEYTLPTPLAGTGALKSGAWAQFSFPATGGGGRAGYVDYIDIQGVGLTPEVPFWTAFRGSHEINAAAPDGAPP